MVKKRKYPEDWGENLYHVSVVKSVDDSGELFIYADYTEIGTSGELNFNTILGDDEIETTVTLQSAQWKMCFIVDQNDENFGVPLNIISFHAAVRFFHADAGTNALICAPYACTWRPSPISHQVIA